MTNREKLTKTNIYDLIMEYVTKRLHLCPISFFGDKKKDTKHCLKVKCSKCFGDWLNQEADPSRPQWQDAMMKNFLRR